MLRNMEKLNNIETLGGVRSANGCEQVSVPSLSKGTLKRTKPKKTLQNVSQTIVKTQLITYPDKVKLIKFKNPFLRNPNASVKPSRGGSTTPRTDPDEIRERSIRRTRKQLNDLTACNDFDKFATFTFDPKKHDAYNHPEMKLLMQRWLSNQKRLYGDFRYIIVSEPMKDGKIHFHALLGGFNGKYHKTKTVVRNKTTIQRYKIDSWEKNNGFADMEDIQDKQRLTNYIVKYITKDIEHVETDKKRYWASRNLLKPVVTDNGEMPEPTYLNLNKTSHWENEHCEIITVGLRRQSPWYETKALPQTPSIIKRKITAQMG